MDFGAGPQRLSAGDAFLLANAPSYMLANDEHAFPGDGIAMFDWQHTDFARLERLHGHAPKRYRDNVER